MVIWDFGKVKEVNKILIENLFKKLIIRVFDGKRLFKYRIVCSMEYCANILVIFLKDIFCINIVEN